MRGTLVERRHFVLIVGIIPAYAGNTKAGDYSASETWDHPRVCGEHRCDVSAACRDAGSSPRMRGTRENRFRDFDFDGIIPAYAGNTDWLSAFGADVWDHPRVCGEH